MQGVIAQGGKIFVVDDLKVRAPGRGEVGIRVLASGLCRSDLLPIDEGGSEAVVIGHEAAGVIETIGDGVLGLAPGQRVAVTCQVPCNRCEACARGLFSACERSFGQGQKPFTWRGESVRSMARVSSLATHITVDAFQVHPVENLDAAAAALIGCAVSTGYGMTKNVARLQTGESLAVFGVGGIGINSIQTGRLLGASRVVAIDVNPTKEPMALDFGADQFVLIDPSLSADELAAKLLADMGGKVDAIVDCTGVPKVLEASQKILNRGGRLGLVGIPHGREAAIAALDINNAMHNHLTIRGALNGASDPFVDFPNIVQLAEQGRLNLADQITHRWPLAEAPAAFDALRAGKVLRAVVEMPEE